jgi:hypothetical protein
MFEYVRASTSSNPKGLHGLYRHNLKTEKPPPEITDMLLDFFIVFKSVACN